MAIRRNVDMKNCIMKICRNGDCYRAKKFMIIGKGERSSFCDGKHATYISQSFQLFRFFTWKLPKRNVDPKNIASGIFITLS